MFAEVRVVPPLLPPFERGANPISVGLRAGSERSVSVRARAVQEKKEWIAMARKVRRLEKDNVAVTTEMESIKIELARAQEELEEERLGLQQSKERQAELAKIASKEEEMAREKRVAHLQEVAARRIGQMEVSRAWLTWSTKYEEHAWRQRVLRQVAGRMMRPKLTACLTHWRRDWEVTMVKAKAQKAREELAERETMLSYAEQSRQALEVEMREVRQALEAEANQLQEIQRLAAAKEEEMREIRVTELQQLAARRIGQLSLSRGWLTWLSQYEQHHWQQCLL
eukprot:5523863-Prymnesium_polylepis.1